jgi:hypothetical protein
VLRRVLEAFDDDGDIAFRHAWNGRCPQRESSAADYKAFQRCMRERITPCMPVAMSTKMLLKPLALSPRMQGWAVVLISAIVRRVAGGPAAASV